MQSCRSDYVSDDPAASFMKKDVHFYHTTKYKYLSLPPSQKSDVM